MGAFSAEGTRFNLFPQAPSRDGPAIAETVQISSPAGSVGPGPSDDRAYTVYPVGKTSAYGIADDPRARLAACCCRRGAARSSSRRCRMPAGHFDYLEPGTPQFEMAHLFGTVRFVLDVWEGYFGRPIRWHFERDYPRIELSILPIFDNAYSGYGFIEVGGHGSGEDFSPYSLNFDVIAHEVGHADHLQRGRHSRSRQARPANISASTNRRPISSRSSRRCTSSSVVDDLLLTTRGNLYTLNALSRMAELSDQKQIRIAANDRRLREFVRGWKKEHDLSRAADRRLLRHPRRYFPREAARRTA